MITIKNNNRIVLEPVYDDPISQDKDFDAIIGQTLLDPMKTPRHANQAVVFSENNQTVDDQMVLDQIYEITKDAINPLAEKEVNHLLNQSLVYFNPNHGLNLASLYAIQAASKASMPFPTASVLYTPGTDVIPSCRTFLGGQSDENELFASFAFTFRPKTIGVYFADETVFNQFKQTVATLYQSIASALDQKTKDLLADIQTLKLNRLTESILLRNDIHEGVEPNHFARIIVNELMNFVKNNQRKDVGFMPFDYQEFIQPTSLVFINIDKHSRATTRQVALEWEVINKSLQNKIKMVSQSRLSRLTAIERKKNNIRVAANNARNMPPDLTRAKRIRFKKRPPTKKECLAYLNQIIKKMSQVAQSQNAYKVQKTSFTKSNRRDPKNWDKPGKIMITRFKPDIHLYVDTSGSISEENYQDAVQLCIYIAKKLNVNLYFNSFSHMLSQTALLKTRNKSVKDIYKEIERLDKVTGGTNFEQVWNFINGSKRREKELSLIITDFGFIAPNQYVKHPKNLYYLPCANMGNLDYYAEGFVKSMKHIDPKCRSKILF